MQRIRLAAVSYLNALPLTWGFTRGRQRGLFDVMLAPPAECARLLQDGLADVALIPSIEFARTSGLSAVPGTGISARTEVRSVLLLSRVPPPSIRTLAVDANSRTSVALARLILERLHRCRPQMEAMPPEPEAMLARHDAALVIGDAALRASLSLPPAAGGLHVMDLAREWTQMTRLPFLFAFWACRPVVEAVSLKESFDRSLEEGLLNIDRIAAEESTRTALPPELIASYLRQNIHYRIGSEETGSLRVFFRMCRESGLLPPQERRALSSISSDTRNSG